MDEIGKNVCEKCGKPSLYVIFAKGFSYNDDNDKPIVLESDTRWYIGECADCCKKEMICCQNCQFSDNDKGKMKRNRKWYIFCKKKNRYIFWAKRKKCFVNVTNG